MRWEGDVLPIRLAVVLFRMQMQSAVICRPVSSHLRPGTRSLLKVEQNEMEMRE